MSHGAGAGIAPGSPLVAGGPVPVGDRLTGDHGDLIAARLPTTTPLRHRVVDGAGHFSFLAAFPPSQDPPGFDRAAFHAGLYPEVRVFLEQ